MEIFITIVAGILITIGTYLALSRMVLRIILGLSLFTHGSHLMMMAINGLKKGAAPLVREGVTQYTDPVPQALILTSIVISFALTALYLVLAYRTYVVLGTDDMTQLKGQEYE
ncbi:MAG TPA: Na(+)/H(+) antiporter subunit C [Sphingobacteriaceae bacterium]|nr:Na(+)/H(+) antiporter subunit C [Sphingobacteriaceae bacterium]